MIRFFLALTVLLTQWFSTLTMSWPGQYVGSLFAYAGIDNSELFISALLAGAAVFWLKQRAHIGGWTTGLRQILLGLVIIALLHSAVIGTVAAIYSEVSGKPDAGFAILALIAVFAVLGPWLHAVILVGNILLVVGVLRYLRGPILEPQSAVIRKPAVSKHPIPSGRAPSRVAGHPLRR
ncbi:MAG: hypothetical protein Q8L16_22105 [Hydrogenophaga sp.]|jgi:hypothetical protein|nr:hypothetical protein [Hydrogenophaga sp.]